MHRMILGGVVTALLAAHAPVSAQAAAGFRAGIRTSALETGQGTSAVAEPVYGVYMGFGLSDRLAFQTELIYGVRGAGELALGTDALDETAGAIRLDMQYLEVPMLLRAGFPAGRVLASVFAGPYAAFLLSCEVTSGDAAGACDDEAATQRFTPRTTDFGFVAGAGLDLALGETTLFVDARYSRGILSIQSADSPFDARHAGTDITVGLAVPLGRY